MGVHYLSRFGGTDRLAIRLVVISCLVLCTAITALYGAIAYQWAVTYYGDLTVMLVRPTSVQPPLSPAAGRPSPPSRTA